MKRFYGFLKRIVWSKGHDELPHLDNLPRDFNEKFAFFFICYGAAFFGHVNTLGCIPGVDDNRGENTWKLSMSCIKEPPIKMNGYLPYHNYHIVEMKTTAQKILDNPTGTGYSVCVLAKSKTRFGSRNVPKGAQAPNSQSAFFMLCDTPGGLCAGPSGRRCPFGPVFQPRAARLFCLEAKKADLFNRLPKGDSL
jgi:hypothetical protein